MDMISYSLSKKIASSAVSGVSSMSVDGTTLNIDTNDGQRLQMVFPVPKDGVSITDIDVNANNQIVFTMSDGTEFISGKIPTVKGDKGDPFKYSDFTTEQLDSLKGSDGFSPTATVEKVGKVATITITDKNGTTTATIKDGEGSEGGEANVIDSISVNGVNVVPDENKNVDITVPSIDGLAKTEDIPTKVSELTNDSGYLTEHQDISGKVDKVEGKSLIADSEIERLASVDNYDDTQVKTQIQAVANGLMDSVGYSADYKTIDIIAKNGVKKSVNVAPIISHASITELSDVDTTNKATGKALVYNATTSKHEYADVSGTDEKVKMDASTDAKYLGELLDNVTIANENGELKVKKLDGQEVTITEINYLKGLTMNVMDLVNMFSNGGVKIINTPVATYAELLTLDKSSFIEGISYLVYVLADENHDNAKTTYLVDKDSEIPTYFGFADSQRDFTTNPIDLATEITGKLGIANMDSDAIKALFTVDDTYKTETSTNNAFSTHGAKALYDELLLAIGNKANDSDLTAHKDDTDIHVSTEDRTKWDSAKTHADSAHAPSNAQANVIETVKLNGSVLTPTDKAVNVTVPTKVSELTDSADYAKKTDIPTTLPADGGNADTVNNHTVETNVPADAKFTDTVYDDTEVKGSIDELSSNLDGLEYSEVAGGKNLFKYNEVSGTLSKTVECSLDAGTYTISALVNSSDTDSSTSLINFYYEDGNSESYLLGRESRTSCTVTLTKHVIALIFHASKDYVNSANDTFTYSDIQIEKGTTATQYESYIPSVKMLAEENAQQSSDLDGLGYGENGVYNILDLSKLLNSSFDIEEGNITNKITDTKTIFNFYVHLYDKDGKIINEAVKTNISSNESKDFTFSLTSGCEKIRLKHNGSSTDITIGMINIVDIGLKENDTITVHISVSSSNPTVVGGIVIKELAIVKGDTFIGYKPYIPSVKMLAEENAQQSTAMLDAKMLGWSVPKECPIQNYVDSDGVFHQRVGRVDLGNLDWSYSSDTTRFSTTGIIDYKKKDSSTNTWIANAFLKDYNTVSGNDTASDSYDKSIGFNGINDMFFVRNTSYTDATSFKNAMQGQYLYYELATEITTNVDGNEAVAKVNDSLSVIGKCKNLLNSTLQTTTNNGVTCTNNGDGTYTLNGTATGEAIFIVIDQYDLKKTFGTNEKLRLTGAPKGSLRPGYYLQMWKNEPEVMYFDTGGGVIVKNPNADCNVAIRVSNGTVCNNVLFKPMLTTNLSATYDDFVPYTGDGETLTHDVAELKNDLAVKKFELVAGVLWLCVSGKHCVLTLNGYNLTEPTHFDKLKEYQPYLVARNVVSKGDGVCIAAVDPNGNINASDLVVGTQLTGQLFGEISWIANI